MPRTTSHPGRAAVQPPARTRRVEPRPLGPAVFIACLLLATPLAADLPDGFVQSVFVTDLQDPSAMTFAPDGRLFVSERIRGEVRIIMPDGRPLPDPFLTVDVPRDEHGRPVRHRSAGLRAIAFDPDFPAEPYVYVFYMAHEPRHNRLSRFRVRDDDPNRADPDSEKILFELPYNDTGSSGSHNGGAVLFGPDGSLYFTSGDGWEPHGQWGGGDPVQSLQTYTGKVFRIHRDGSIPPDNPFYHQAKGPLRAIYALGMRNPYTLATHPETGHIYVNDPSGPNKDNIFKLAPGANYGHAHRGDDPTAPSAPGTPHPPVAQGGSFLIAGGAWYPNTGPFPRQYHGNYFVACWGGNDANPGRITRLVSDTDPTVHTFLAEAGGGPRGKPTYTAIGPDGALYWLATTYETSVGTVYRIRWEGGPARAAAPAIRPNGGRFARPVTVRLEAQTPGAVVRYTLDGSEPAADSPIYTAPFTINADTTVKARAFREGLDPSQVAAAPFTRFDDTDPPRIASVITTADPAELRVIFTKPLDPNDARDPARYRLDRGARVESARLEYDFRTVALRTTPLDPGIEYTLAAGPIRDRADPPNAMPPDTRVSFTPRSEDEPAAGYGLARRPAVEPFLNMPPTADGPMPPRLSETGAFADVRTLTPAPGLIPYQVNTPLWSDGAPKQRWIALPADPAAAPGRIGFSAAGEWAFPPGTVFVKHFGLVTDRPARLQRRLETRLLVADAAGGYYGVTYIWRDDQAEADLLDSAMTEPIPLTTRDGHTLTQDWYYPSRFDCMTCHTPQAGYVLGVNTRQLNRPFTHPETGIADNQLRAWDALGLFDGQVGDRPAQSLDRLAPLDDPHASVEHRVRSYLDANCAGCHRPGGVNHAMLDLRFDTPLDATGLIHGPLGDPLGVERAAAVFPAHPGRSIVHKRMAADDPRIMMPPLARNLPDAQALALIERWIAGLDAQPPPRDPGLIAHWAFDEPDGELALDASGHNRAGRFAGRPRRTEGRRPGSRAVDFDGRTARIEINAFDIPSAPDAPADALTLAAWIKPHAFVHPAAEDRIISKAIGIAEQDHYWMLSTIRQDGEVRLRFRLKAGGRTDTLIADRGRIAPGEWAHVAATYDGRRMTLFLNGQQVGSRDKRGPVDAAPHVPLWIADNPPNAGERPFRGLIDEVRILNRALSPGQLRRLAELP